jgi:hypothetical protein
VTRLASLVASLRAWAAVPARLEALDRTIADMRHGLAAAFADVRRDLAAAPGPFVCVLIEAESERGPTTLGGVGRIDGRGQVLVEVMAQMPLEDVRVTVFVDLERVSVHAILLGRDIVTAALGECPVAFFPRWEVGMRLSVQCLAREGGHRG